MCDQKEPEGQPSKRLSADSRRDQLLDIGKWLFNSRRYSEISVDDNAQAAGISKGLLYHYFESKKDFFLIGLREAAVELLNACKVDPALSYEEQVSSGIKRYLDYVEERSFAYLNLFYLFRDESGALPELVEVIEEVRQQLLHRLVGRQILPRDKAAPATRIALRGFLGYAEASVLYWLENGLVDRLLVEQILISNFANALSTGFRIDFGANSDELKTVQEHLSALRTRYGF
jgi:AcrR family transcriptional regulator